MQILIDIPEDIATDIKDYCGMSIADAKKNLPIILNAIHNGTPLPKGHGRLIDSELLDKRLNFVLNNTGGYKNTPIGTGIVIAMAENLDAKPIIEADKESEVEE